MKVKYLIKMFFNFINYFFIDIHVILQKYVNHGGYVVKLYGINNTGYTYFRPSFPDFNKNSVSQYEEFQKGFYSVHTDELLSESYLNFWNKLNKKEEIKDLVDKNFLNIVLEKYINFTQSSIIGLDFVYDYIKKEYYLIDANIFPGYKELNNEFNQLLIEHIIFYYREWKRN